MSGGLTLEQIKLMDSAPQAETSSTISPSDEGYTLEEIKSGLPEHDSPLERAKTVGEGVLQGALGPVGTAISIGFGSDPQAMRERASAHPIAHGASEAAGFLGSMGTGKGIAPVLEMAGKATAKKLGASGVLAGGTKMATELGLLSAGDEVSKLIQNDPDQSLGSAAANIGMSAALGLGGGTALSGLGAMAAAKGGKLNQFLEDFKGRMDYHLNNPDPVGVLGKELEDHYQAVKGMADEVYGPTGIKAQDIAKAVPESHPRMIEQVAQVESKVGDALEAMRVKPELYPRHLVAQLEDWEKIYKDGVEGQFKTSADYFNAIQELKQKAQNMAKYGQRIPSYAPEYKFVDSMREMANDLKTALEDKDIWGKAATRQEAINKAFTEFHPALKDFERKFTTELNGQKVVDPTKINTYVNQLGKPNAELKKEMLENFLNASEKYKNVIDKSHANLGLEAPEWNSSLALTKESLNDLPPGAHLADALVKRGLAKFGGRALGAIGGAGFGKFFGMSGFGAIIGEHTLGPLLESILPALTKPILEGPANAEGLKGAIDYSMAIVKGDRILSKAAKNIFVKGASILPDHVIPTEKTLEKFDKSLKAASNDPNRLLQSGQNVAHYLPQHTVAITKSAMDTISALNALKPNTDPQFPLEDDRQPSKIEQSTYNRALMIAEQPAVLLNNIPDGTLLPNDVTFLKQLHPGAYNNMKDKVVAAMVDHIGKGESIPYKTQLGLSIFLEQPLMESLSPGNVIANQMVGKQQQAPQGEAQNGKPRGQKTALQKLSGMYNTPIQAREREKNSA